MSILWNKIAARSLQTVNLVGIFIFDGDFGMYDVYDGALPGDFMILLCLCKGDLNGEQFMLDTVLFCLHSVRLNGEIIVFLFLLCKLNGSPFCLYLRS